MKKIFEQPEISTQVLEAENVMFTLSTFSFWGAVDEGGKAIDD